ncbi:MAG: AraC family transcriptional regulator [Chthoniobacteraceae bacterium]
MRTAGSALHETPAWRGIRGTWQPLHGGFFERGLSVEWHDFHVDRDMNWARSFHPRSLEICLNFSGTAELHDGAAERSVGPNELAIYTTQGERMRAVRHSGSLHRFITLELSASFLRTQFADVLDRLKPPVRRFIESGAMAPAFLETLPLPATMLTARTHFVEPPVPAPARDTWYLGRVLEILAQTFFQPDDSKELFCHRHKRTNRERIERARYLIERDLENPPSLGMLAEEIGCSSYHLSRTFAQETGVSFPKFLRMKRIEKAAEFLCAGRMNVTEAAMAVGYSSLSAFNKAFVEQLGCCPGLYPHVKLKCGRLSPAG